MKTRRLVPLALLAAFATGCLNTSDRSVEEEFGVLGLEESSPIETVMVLAVEDLLEEVYGDRPTEWVGFQALGASHNFPPEVAAAWGHVAKAVGTTDERAGVEWIPNEKDLDGVLVPGLHPETRVIRLMRFVDLVEDRESGRHPDFFKAQGDPSPLDEEFFALLEGSRYLVSLFVSTMGTDWREGSRQETGVIFAYKRDTSSGGWKGGLVSRAVP